MRLIRSALATLAVTITPIVLLADPLLFRTFVGTAVGAGHADAFGPAARFNKPTSIAVDGAGNVYVAEEINSTIRKIATTGELSTLAGKPNIPGSRDGSGSGAEFRNPAGVVVLADGTLFVADTGNHTIRRISPQGVVTTLAGSAGQTGGADGSGSAARFNQPGGIATDGTFLYVADRANHTIRRVTLSGDVTTLAGVAGIQGAADGAGTVARFRFPAAIAMGPNGVLYVADELNHAIRTVTPAGDVATFAGSLGVSGNIDGPAGVARLSSPRGVVVDHTGRVFITEASRHRVRQIQQSGAVAQFAGGNGAVSGVTDGAVASARFNGPRGLAVDAAGNVFVADTDNHSIRKIDVSSSTVRTVAGAGAASVDGHEEAARFEGPNAMAADALGNLYVADVKSVRKVTPGGLVTTVAGPGSNGTGTQSFFSIQAVAVDSSGTLFFVSYDDKVWKMTPAGNVSVYAGNGVRGGVDGPALGGAQFHLPAGIVIDAAGTLFVAETGSAAIRKITTDGQVTTFAGKIGEHGSNDGPGTVARFQSPVRLTMDRHGNLYVADQNRVRKITPSGEVSTIGSGTTTLGGVAADEDGNVYASDNHTIIRITPAAEVVGGVPGQRGSADGLGAAARFNSPGALLFHRGVLYVADRGNHTIRTGFMTNAPRRRSARH